MVLDGLKVVSFCHFLQGPAAMQYLSDMGAEMIKIEPPNGAFERHWGGANRVKVGGVTAFYLSANRNARSIALDLKRPEAREVVFRLIEGSHVVAENFRPGALDRLGLGYEAVKARKPDVIYASASGYGGDGPFVGKPGQDLLIQAMSGLAAATGTPATGPVPVGCAVADQHGAALLALGIAGAYARWLKTGEGTRIESTLLGASVDLQMESVVAYYANGADPRSEQRDVRLGSWFHEAPYGIYPLKDAYVAISLNPMAKIIEALGRDELSALAELNPFHDRDRIAAELARELAEWSYSDLAAAFESLGLWFARVEGLGDLARNPQLKHNESFRDVEVNGETIKLLTHPLRYDGEVPPFGGFALTPGADTRAILESSGFSGAEVEELLRDKVAFAS